MTWTHGMQKRAVDAIIEASEAIFGSNWRSRIVQDADIGISFNTIKRWEDRSMLSYAASILPKLNDLGILFEQHAQAHLDLFDKFVDMPSTDEARIQMMKDAGRLMYGVSWMSPMSRMLKEEYDVDACPSLLSKLASGDHSSDRVVVIVDALRKHLWRRAGEIDVASDDFHLVATCLFDQNPECSYRYSYPMHPIVSIGGFSCLAASETNVGCEDTLSYAKTLF